MFIRQRLGLGRNDQFGDVRQKVCPFWASRVFFNVMQDTIPVK